MGNVWLKIKVWTKGIVALLTIVYALLFIYNNSKPTEVWWWFDRRFNSSTVVLIAIAFLAGIISAVLTRTTIRTLQQVRDLRSKSRTERIERDLAEMKQKASRLQTKPSASSMPNLASPPNEPIE
jgi:lysylphosphatidylglycerol synthetase-like protein (DUF2156 family)